MDIACMGCWAAACVGRCPVPLTEHRKPSALILLSQNLGQETWTSVRRNFVEECEPLFNGEFGVDQVGYTLSYSRVSRLEVKMAQSYLWSLFYFKKKTFYLKLMKNSKTIFIMVGVRGPGRDCLHLSIVCDLVSFRRPWVLVWSCGTKVSQGLGHVSKEYMVLIKSVQEFCYIGGINSRAP